MRIFQYTTILGEKSVIYLRSASELETSVALLFCKKEFGIVERVCIDHSETVHGIDRSF